MQEKSKFLILNPSIDGLIKVLEKSNAQYTKNGPFEATVLLGDVIPEGSSIPKDIDIESPTYFTTHKLGISAEIEKKIVDDRSLVDIKTNLTYSKPPYSIIRFKSNLVMMILNDIKEEHLPNIPNDVSIDVIICNDWPCAIATRQQVVAGNELIDKLIKQFTPRYIFSHSTKFFELEPFKWDNGIVTRFLSLAEEGSGEKWFYAFSIGILQDNDMNLNLIDNPFTKKRVIEHSEENEPKKIKVVTPDQCFFCLSNSSTETHMIISIGSYNYLTIAKGPLTRSNKELPFSGHGIIIPIEHIPSIRATNLLTDTSPVYQEQIKYEKSLVEAFQQKPMYRLVFFEISRLNNIHKHVQFMPIPTELLDKFENSLEIRTKKNNTKFKKNQKLEFKKFTNESDPKLIKLLNETDFISFTVHNKENVEIYVSKLDEFGNVDLQFPRRVLAHLLNLPDRVYWDKCQQPKLKEISDCEEFKKFYSSYDFTK